MGCNFMMATDPHRHTQTFFPADLAGKKIATKLTLGNKGQWNGRIVFEVCVGLCVSVGN